MQQLDHRRGVGDQRPPIGARAAADASCVTRDQPGALRQIPPGQVLAVAGTPGRREHQHQVVALEGLGRPARYWRAAQGELRMAAGERQPEESEGAAHTGTAEPLGQLYRPPPRASVRVDVTAQDQRWAACPGHRPASRRPCSPPGTPARSDTPVQHGRRVLPASAAQSSYGTER